MKTSSLTLLLASLMLSVSVDAADPFNKAGFTLEQTFLRYGGIEKAREATTPTAEGRERLCRLCHGPGGNSTNSRYPTLAGERPQYLLKRCYEIRDGGQGEHLSESKTAQRMSRRCSEDEMVALALYYSALPRKPVEYDADLAEQGKENYDAICIECHQADGRGDRETPKIAGQQPDYLYTTLLKFRDNDDWRHGSKMKEVTQKLSPIAIKAVAHYAASLASVAAADGDAEQSNDKPAE